MTIKNGLPPIHPGEFLKETLGELGTSQSEFARVIGVSPMRVSHVVNGTRPVTAELALLLGRAFGQSPQYWLNLQAAYDLKIAEQEIRSRLRECDRWRMPERRKQKVAEKLPRDAPPPRRLPSPPGRRAGDEGILLGELYVYRHETTVLGESATSGVGS